MQAYCSTVLRTLEVENSLYTFGTTLVPTLHKILLYNNFHFVLYCITLPMNYCHKASAETKRDLLIRGNVTILRAPTGYKNKQTKWRRIWQVYKHGFSKVVLK